MIQGQLKVQAHLSLVMGPKRQQCSPVLACVLACLSQVVSPERR